jgi:predicted MFS family arabinose efflux permease
MYGVSEAPVQGWSSAGPLTAIAVGVAALAAMVVVELRAREPIVALRLLGNRLFRSANGVMILGSMAFLGTLYAIALYYQDGRGLSPLKSGLNTFPEAIGVMLGAQLASRVLYPLLGPRRHIAVGLTGVAVSISLLAPLTATSSLWFARALMFALGFCMAQVFVPCQAVAFATIEPAATGRASTMFNAVRQLGGAIGVAVLTTAVVLAGNGDPDGVVGSVTPYRAAFIVAALLALLGIGSALTINDAAAVNTMPETARARRRAESATDDTVPEDVAA